MSPVFAHQVRSISIAAEVINAIGGNQDTAYAPFSPAPYPLLDSTYRWYQVSHAPESLSHAQWDNH